MKLFYAAIFFLFSYSSVSFAQSRFKPGYIVDLQKDTLKGFIDYRGWDQNPKTISFKNNGAIKTYTVNEATAFGVNDLEDYQKFTVNASTANTSINFLSIKADTSSKQITSFFKVILHGAKISLYSFTDSIKTRYFALDNTTTKIKELDYYLYFINEGKQQTQSLNLYRDQLKEFAALYQPGNVKLISKIEYAPYTERALTDIAAQINGGTQQQKKQPKTSGVRWFAGGFYRHNTIKTGGEVLFPPGAKGMANSPGITAGLDLLFNNVTQRAYFRIEVSYIRNHYYIPPILVNASNLMASIDFKQSTVSATPQVVYNFYSADKLKAFINAGVSFNYSSYNKYYYKRSYSDASYSSEVNYPEFNKFWTEVPVKLGIQLNNRIELYGSYSPSFTIAAYGGFSAAVSYYQAGVNYLFK